MMELRHRAIALVAESLFKSNNLSGIHLFPQCTRDHYWVMVADMKEETIYSLDSLNWDHLSEAIRLCSLLKVGMC